MRGEPPLPSWKRSTHLSGDDESTRRESRVSEMGWARVRFPEDAETVEIGIRASLQRYRNRRLFNRPLANDFELFAAPSSRTHKNRAHAVLFSSTRLSMGRIRDAGPSGSFGDPISPVGGLAAGEQRTVAQDCIYEILNDGIVQVRVRW